MATSIAHNEEWRENEAAALHTRAAAPYLSSQYNPSTIAAANPKSIDEARATVRVRAGNVPNTAHEDP